MKKALAIFGAAVVAATALSACNAEDGKINDHRGYNNMVSEEVYTSRRTVSETSSVRTDRNDTDTHDGILHDIGSMTGDVIDDVADGLDDIGSTITSNAEDFFDGNSDMSD